MPIKIGETATATARVDVQYRCSSCGKDNLETQSLSGMVETGTIFGINLNQHLHADAQKSLLENMELIMDESNPGRYTRARFTCACRHCGHIEPWAKMNYSALDMPQKILLYVLVFGILPLLPTFSLRPISWFHIIVWTLYGLCAAAFAGILFYKYNNDIKMQALTLALPCESIPIVTIYAKERHEAFRKAYLEEISNKTRRQLWFVGM